MKNIVYTLLTVLLACAGSVHGREIGSSSPERQGFSSDRLDRLTQFMEAKVDDGTMVGGLGVIARNGKVIYIESFGQADREAGRVMEEDAIFRIYSMTKPITGVALMMLYEEGKFRLSDPIAWYMPELANLEVAFNCRHGGYFGWNGQSRSRRN
jgi:CubicO group peptidase (beta-lactamase class C family)